MKRPENQDCLCTPVSALQEYADFLKPHYNGSGGNFSPQPINGAE
jgi:hypothetical protein